MSPRTGRPLKGETKRDYRVAVKMNEREIMLLDECAKCLNTTRTDVVIKGVELVKREMDEKK